MFTIVTKLFMYTGIHVSKLMEIKTCSYTTLAFYRRMDNVYGNYMTSPFVTLKPHQSVFAKFIHFIFYYIGY